MARVLEVACFNLESALIAQEAGADRIELCQNYAEGGTTPSAGLIQAAQKYLKIPFYVMVSPRDKPYIYTNAEIESIKLDIEYCKLAGVRGIVIGALTTDVKVDKVLCAELIALAKPMELTYHRAFDAIIDKKSALEDLIELGFDRVLTSGNTSKAVENIELYNELNIQAKGRIKIIAGGGVRSHNILDMVSNSTTEEFHSAGILDMKGNVPIASIDELKAIKLVIDNA